MNSYVSRSMLVAVALATVCGPATAGMSMGSGGSRNADRDYGNYPGYGAGSRYRGDGPYSRDPNRRGYGQGMRMGSGQGEPRQGREQYRQQYRYGQGVPGYGRGAPGYAPRAPAGEQNGQDQYQGYPRGGPDYGRGGPGAAPGYRQGGGF